MSAADDLLADGRALLEEVFAVVTLTYAQGANSKAAISARRTAQARATTDARGSPLEECVFAVAVSAFASGFSASSPVYPAPDTDTATISGEEAWTVAAVEVHGNGDTYQLTCRRKVLRGSA